jgi:L-threonylcarbamoyladenylate synthase
MEAETVPENINYETPRIFEPTLEVISCAASVIKNGGLVAFPTETVYGLGANALDEPAVRKIFAAKGRPRDNPMILHVSNIREASRYASMNDTAEMLMEHFWPGPLTIVLYSLDNVPLLTRGGLDTVALRAPMNQVALDLVRKCGTPIAGPSANKSGRPSPTTARAVWDDLANAVDMIIDGGSTAIGVESTVIDATRKNVSILRPGGVTREMLEAIVDVDPDTNAHERKRSPGTKYRHYAPSIEVRLWEGDGREIFAQAQGGWCYIGMRTPPEGCVRKIIFETADKYAKGLFSAMRELEKCGANVIIADLPEAVGIGCAIRNRLLHAAT